MTYLLAGQQTELDRLQLQSRVWEPAGERLLAELGDGTGRRVLDVGCGCLGWLRVLSQWVGSSGACIGSDVDERLLAAAGTFVEAESLGNVELVSDDVFDSRLEPASFDLVHARFQLAPLGRFDEQLATFRRLVRPGGVIVLEDPDAASWGFEPPAPAATRLIDWIREAFLAAGGDFDAGRRERGMLAALGLEPHVRAEVVALEPEHPYLRLPLQFAAALRPRLLSLVAEPDLDATLAAVADELADPARWGMSFTLVQTWATVE